MNLLKRGDIDDILHSTASNALMYGPRGTGKTTMAVRTRPIGESYSITLTAEGSSAEIRGHYIQGKGEFEWHDGPAVKAWREGALLVINEIDHASEDASNILHAILDDFEVARLTLPTNETVQPAEGFRVIATMNGTPDQLNEAVLDRFSLILPVNIPSDEMLDALTPEVRQVCERMYKEAASAGLSEPSVTYRTLRAFDQLRKTLGDEKAALAVTVDKGHAQGLMEATIINKKSYARA